MLEPIGRTDFLCSNAPPRVARTAGCTVGRRWHAFDIAGHGLNRRITSIWKALGATLVFDEKSHVHVEFKRALTLANIRFRAMLTMVVGQASTSRSDCDEPSRPHLNGSLPHLWHWREQSFRALKDVAAEAGQTHAWAGYAQYCTQLECGLRKPALEALNRFIQQTETAPFADRKCFVSWLMHQAASSTAAGSLVPYPLRKRLIDPTLAEWLEVEPLSSEPHRWLGGYDHLGRALVLDPTDEIARVRFVSCVVSDVDYAAHELPQGYLGDLHKDLTFLMEAEIAALGLSSSADRLGAIAEIRALQARILAHLNSESRSQP
jgi:hypothetical protein